MQGIVQGLFLQTTEWEKKSLKYCKTFYKQLSAESEVSEVSTSPGSHMATLLVLQ